MEVEVKQLCALLPSKLSKLGEIAFNLSWTWSRDAQLLFDDLDPVLWESCGHNPVRFLKTVVPDKLQKAAKDKRYLAHYASVVADLAQYMSAATGITSKKSTVRGTTKAKDVIKTWFSQTHGAWQGPVAYMSFEFGLHECLPMYAGGLGVLAADHLKEASDQGLPLVGVGFFYLQGYFTQRITEDGWQEADYSDLDVSSLPLTRVRGKDGLPVIISFDTPTMRVNFQVWKAQVGRVSLLLIDTAGVSENAPYVKSLTQRLYNSDPDMRISQEIVLGIGGVKMLRALGINPVVWHMNEGHPAFSTLERARELVGTGSTFEQAVATLRENTVFTTHTPVPAGNDRFAIWQVDRQLNGVWTELGLTRDAFMKLAVDNEGLYGMTVLALRMARKSNGVSKLHGEVANGMWAWMGSDIPKIGYITNGIHAPTWIARRIGRVYARHLGADWQQRIDDAKLWQTVPSIPDEELWEARRHYKRLLTEFMRDRARTKWSTHTRHPVQTIASGVLLDPHALTIGFARRFPTYKRATLVLRDAKRLVRILNNATMPVQIVYAGKSHPNDEPGKQLIQQLYRMIKNADTSGRMVFIEDYDTSVARHLVWGVDVWMNTPRRPYEASGTSGMKAALNGALNFSILDGWWPEAYNGSNGWAIGTEQNYTDLEAQDTADISSLFGLLESQVVPLYYDRDADGIPRKWLSRVKQSIMTCAPQFSTARMVKQYVNEMYAPLVK